MKTEAKEAGIFGTFPKMTPVNVKRWLDLMRAELGWSIAEAAARARIDAADIEELERTGETEALAWQLKRLARIYSEAMFGEGLAWTGAWMDEKPLAVFGDMVHLADFEVGGFLRRQRAAIGLSLEEVCGALRARYKYAGEQYPWIEWGQPIDDGSVFPLIAEVLNFPIVELLRPTRRVRHRRPRRVVRVAEGAGEGDDAEEAEGSVTTDDVPQATTMRTRKRR